MHEIAGISKFLIPIELGSNEILPTLETTHRGLYFIEYGHLRLEHSSNYTVNRTFPRRQDHRGLDPLANVSIGHLNARSAPASNSDNLHSKANVFNELPKEQPFRLARIGPGWVVGMIEECSGLRRAGAYVSGKTE